MRTRRLHLTPHWSGPFQWWILMVISILQDLMRLMIYSSISAISTTVYNSLNWLFNSRILPPEYSIYQLFWTESNTLPKQNGLPSFWTYLNFRMFYCLFQRVTCWVQTQFYKKPLWCVMMVLEMILFLLQMWRLVSKFRHIEILIRFSLFIVFLVVTMFTCINRRAVIRGDVVHKS